MILRFFPTHSSRHSSNLPAARNVYAKQIVLVAQPCLARTLRAYLFAMSAALDVHKCFRVCVSLLPRSTLNKLCLSHSRALHGHFVYICLLCPLRSMSANVLRLRLSSSTVYAKQIVLVAQPCLARTLRVHLFAMSASLDVRKCFALASLFACGQSGYRVRHAQRADMKYPTSVGKRKRHSFECLFFGDPTEVRTRVTAVKGRCLRPLDHRAVYSICISWWKLQDSNL